jgi:hypothetical protein
MKKKTGITVVTDIQGGLLEQIHPAMHCHISPKSLRKQSCRMLLFPRILYKFFVLPVVLSPRQRVGAKP